MAFNIKSIIDSGISQSNKTVNQGKLFSKQDKGDLVVFVENGEMVKSGLVSHPIHDGKLVGKIISRLIQHKELERLDVYLNYINAKSVVAKHGLLDINDLVVIINQPDEIIFNQGRGGYEMLTIIKYAKNGYGIVVVTRINGFGVVTQYDRYFEDSTTNKAKKYLNSILRRGICIYSKEGRRPSSIAPQRVPASLSGVNEYTEIVTQKTKKVKQKA